MSPIQTLFAQSFINLDYRVGAFTKFELLALRNSIPQNGVYKRICSRLLSSQPNLIREIAFFENLLLGLRSKDQIVNILPHLMLNGNSDTTEKEGLWASRLSGALEFAEISARRKIEQIFTPIDNSLKKQQVDFYRIDQLPWHLTNANFSGSPLRTASLEIHWGGNNLVLNPFTHELVAGSGLVFILLKTSINGDPIYLAEWTSEQIESSARNAFSERIKPTLSGNWGLNIGVQDFMSYDRMFNMTRINKYMVLQLENLNNPQPDGRQAKASLELFFELLERTIGFRN